jgi:hypothetical protein
MVARRGEGAGGCEGGPWAAQASPLWTLQRLCFGPDVAADILPTAERTVTPIRQQK